jgi:hypothetical protein
MKKQYQTTLFMTISSLKNRFQYDPDQNPGILRAKIKDHSKLPEKNV